jgi:formylglycine-generating enzyme required for sulfatase activity
MRGGCFVVAPAAFLHSAARMSTETDSRGDVTGFRVARTCP